MANRQIYQLTHRVLSPSDIFPSQDDDGIVEAGKATLQELKDLLVPKEFACVFSQVSTNDPTLDVIENPFGEVTVTRNSIGNYSIIINGAFPSAKSIVVTMNQSVPLGNKAAVIFLADESTITVLTRTIDTGEFADWGLSSTLSIIVKVYP